MNAPSADTHYAAGRKIKPGMKRDNTPDDNDRIEIGPTQLAFDEWAAAGIACPDVPAMRAFRLKRLQASISARGVAAALLTDPLNIRYATDTTNMQLWNTHNPFRACLVTASGYMAVWEYTGSHHLTSYNPLVTEVRKDASLFYCASGDRTAQAASAFAAEIAGILAEHAPGEMRLAVDKIMLHGSDALRAAGFTLTDGEELMEKTRAVKGPDEIAASRCALHACEMALAEVRRRTKPGMTENDVWAILHAENIRRGGEWIETRLLSSGPRTNPYVGAEAQALLSIAQAGWYQECGPRVIQNNEILAWDTDLIGVYGMCVDISRTWFIGDGEPTREMIETYREAYLQITENAFRVRPGMTMKQLSFGSREIPPEFSDMKYSCVMHGVGLSDEWPCVKYKEFWEEGQIDYKIEPGMILSAEVYLGKLGGKFGIKLEDQILVTEEGVENMTRCPFDAKLMDGMKAWFEE